MEKGTFFSSNNTNVISYYIISPTKPKAVLQFSHGMAEHSERYEEFGQYLADKGIAFCISSHLGHKGGVKDDGGLGFFGKKDGWKYLVYDTAKFTEIIKEKFPGIPFVIGGHSMGSFVVRAYLAMYPDKADYGIIVGTANATLLVSAGVVIAKTVAFFRGDKYKSKMLDSLTFGSANKNINNPKTKFDWLSTDDEVVKKYIDDPYCGFLFTASAFANAAAMIKYVSSGGCLSKMNKDVKLLITSGKEDPVSEYGRTVHSAYDAMKNSGIYDVELKLYESGRHEILNERNNVEVYADILNWINRKINS